MGLLTDRSKWNTVELAYFMARLTQVVYATDQAGFRNLVSQQEGFLTDSGFFTASSTMPRWAWAKFNGGGVVCIGGCSQLSHGQLLTEGYIAGSFTPYDLPVNAYLSARLGEIMAVLNPSGANHGQAFVCGGHSLGGALAQLVATATNAASPATNVACHTFGAPKPGNVQVMNQQFQNVAVRWMWSADPVPLLPFLVDDSPSWVSLLPAPARRSLPYWVHPRGGIELRASGNPREHEFPSAASVAPFSALASWLLALDQPVNDVHSIEVYINQLSRLQPTTETSSGPNLRVWPEGRPQQQDSKELTAAERNFVNTIVTQEREQNAVPVVIPKVNAFAAERNGRIWLLTFGGVTVGMSASRRYAQRTARHLNDALARLQKCPAVDTTALQDQFSGYLAVATDPAGPFKPTMQTQF